jgi:hypothetical protein
LNRIEDKITSSGGKERTDVMEFFVALVRRFASAKIPLAM